jgi:hypothetical protein
MRKTTSSEPAPTAAQWTDRMLSELERMNFTAERTEITKSEPEIYVKA